MATIWIIFITSALVSKPLSLCNLIAFNSWQWPFITAWEVLMALGDRILPIHHRSASILHKFLVCSVTPMGISIPHMPLSFTQVCGETKFHWVSYFKTPMGLFNIPVDALWVILQSPVTLFNGSWPLTGTPCLFAVVFYRRWSHTWLDIVGKFITCNSVDFWDGFAY